MTYYRLFQSIAHRAQILVFVGELDCRAGLDCNVKFYAVKAALQMPACALRAVCDELVSKLCVCVSQDGAEEMNCFCSRVQLD